MVKERRLFGYARVSGQTEENSFEIQQQKLLDQGIRIKNIYADKTNSISFQTFPELQKLLQHLRSGDILYITQLDNLGETGTNSVLMINKLEKKGIEVRSLDLPNGILNDSKLVSIRPILDKFIKLIAQDEANPLVPPPRKRINVLKKNIQLSKEKSLKKKSFLLEIGKLIKIYQEMHPTLNIPQLRTLIGEEYYRKENKIIKPIAKSTYYKALKKIEPLRKEKLSNGLNTEVKELRQVGKQKNLKKDIIEFLKEEKETEVKLAPKKKRLADKTLLEKPKEKPPKKFSLGFYQGSWGIEKELENYHSKDKDVFLVVNPQEFATLYKQVNKPWIRIVILITYLYGWTIDDFYQFTSSSLEMEELEKKQVEALKEVGMEELEGEQLEALKMRQKFGDFFKNEELNYQNELHKQMYIHFQLNKNKYLLSLNKERSDEMHLQVVLRNIRKSLFPTTTLNSLRSHAILHFYYYSKVAEMTKSVYGVSSGYVYKLKSQIFFELEALEFEAKFAWPD